MSAHIQFTSTVWSMEAASFTATDVRDALTQVIDPELGADIVDLGMVQDVSIDGLDVTITVALTTSGCPLRAQIRDDAIRAILGLGATDVHVKFGEMNQEQRSAVMLRARASAQTHAPTTRIAPTTRCIAVASGKGGVGKSSVAVNTAAALAHKGFTVGLLDADIAGFSVPRMLGLSSRLEALVAPDGQRRIAPQELAVGSGTLKVVSTGLLLDDETTALMWRGPILDRAVEQFLEDVEWGDLDYLIVDMPPGTGDIQMGLARRLPHADLLIVTTPSSLSQHVAARAVDMARRSHVRVLGIVENFSSFTCEHNTSYALFGSGGGLELAAFAHVPLLAQIPISPEVATAGDTGAPVVLNDMTSPAAIAFYQLAHQIADELAPPVDMSSCSTRLLERLDALAAS